MTPGGYLKDRMLLLLVQGMGVFLLSLYLYAVGNTAATVLLIDLVWVLGAAIWFMADYRRKRRWFSRLDAQLDEMDRPYLIHEVTDESWRLEDRLYRDVLRKSNRAVMERMEGLEREQGEYREFIESWIHQVKLPITGIRLAIRDSGPSARRVETYLTELENDVEQALFYARSDQVYRDYMIRETALEPVVNGLLVRNKHLLIQKGMGAEVDCGGLSVPADAQWLEFILGQILFNAVKYKREGGGHITFRAEAVRGGVNLTVRDDGIGIPPEELPRIFDKGFTGTNGRDRGKSTGIGLYLCRKLCGKLGIELTAESVQGEYTALTLFFPKHPILSTL